MVLQGRYHCPSSKWSIAAHWTQMKNDGNFEGEAANQPGAPSIFADYPESFAADRNFPPAGSTTSSVTRSAPGRPTLEVGRFGAVDLSALWRYNSGLTYSLRER